MSMLIDFVMVPLSYGFMQRALVVAVLVGAVCSVLSCYLVLKGWSLMGDAISHAVLPGMLARGSGRIVNVASVAGFVPRGTYGAVKGWLIQFSRWANARYRRRGVTVTAVCPGFVHTNFHERMGLPPGQEGVPDWLWLAARDVVSESLRDVARGKSVSVPSLRYKAIVGLTRVLPAGLLASVGERGR